MGLSIREVLIVAFVLALLSVVVLSMLAQTSHRPLAPRCRSRQRQLFKGVCMYLDDFGEYFPLAWHEGSGERFGEVTYSRFLIETAQDPAAQFRSSASDEEQVELFENNAIFWADPARGVTLYYFSPPTIFRLPNDLKAPFDGHAQYSKLTAEIPSVFMPMLAGTNAAIPDDEAEDKGEPYTGIPGGFKPNWIRGGSIHDAFYGVARSWSRWDPESKTGSGHERFDYRHNGAINVLFLDGHVDTMKKNQADRLEKLHENWNIDSEGAP